MTPEAPKGETDLQRIQPESLHFSPREEVISRVIEALKKDDRIKQFFDEFFTQVVQWLMDDLEKQQLLSGLRYRVVFNERKRAEIVTRTLHFAIEEINRQAQVSSEAEITGSFLKKTTTPEKSQSGDQARVEYSLQPGKVERVLKMLMDPNFFIPNQIAAEELVEELTPPPVLPKKHA